MVSVLLHLFFVHISPSFYIHDLDSVYYLTSVSGYAHGV